MTIVRMEHASLGELAHEVFARIEQIDALEELEPSQPHIDTAKAALIELRKRAIEKRNTAHLCDVQTLASEVQNAIGALVQRVKERRERSGLLVAGQ